MPTLFPPLVASSDSATSIEGDVLSPELRAQFEALHSVVLTKRNSPTPDVPTPGGTAVLSTADVPSAGGAAVLSPYSDGPPKHEWKGQCDAMAMAVATAVSAEEEIEALSTGIAELEELLASLEKKRDPQSHSCASTSQRDFPFAHTDDSHVADSRDSESTGSALGKRKLCCNGTPADGARDCNGNFE